MRLLVAFCLCLVVLGPAHAALREDDRALALAVIQYGHDNIDPQTGLVRDTTGVPSVAESSIGYVAACFLLGQDLEVARQVLEHLLECQQADGPTVGQFPWQGGTGSKVSEEALLYVAPLLAVIYREGGANLGEVLAGKLKLALERAWMALDRMRPTPTEEDHYLRLAAALATVGSALGNGGPAQGTKMVRAWLSQVTANGLPAGHSPTFDAVKLLALKWVYEVAPEPSRPTINDALLLTAQDLAQRLHPSLTGLAGAQSVAFPSDYLAAPGFASYVLYTDFGGPRPSAPEPYLMAALTPGWRAPQAVRALVTQPLPRLVRTTSKPPATQQATTTFLGPGFSLGTLSGEVDENTIPLYATFAAAGKRPSLYAFCSPAPCHVQSLQNDNLALLSFNFDNLGAGSRKQAWVRLILGSADDIDQVYAYNQPWNDQPTSLGERESVALVAHGCYVGLTLTRSGPAANQEGPLAKPAALHWDGGDRKGDLSLLLYARQADYGLAQPIYDVRAGFIIELAPRAAYPSLADFAKHLEATRLKQTGRVYKERLPEKEKPVDPNVMLPQPRAKTEYIYRNIVEQTIEYTNGPRRLRLVEDLLGEQTLQAFVGDQEVKPAGLWDTPAFKLEPGGDLSRALQPLAGQ